MAVAVRLVSYEKLQMPYELVNPFLPQFVAVMCMSVIVTVCNKQSRGDISLSLVK